MRKSNFENFSSTEIKTHKKMRIKHVNVIDSELLTNNQLKLTAANIISSEWRTKSSLPTNWLPRNSYDFIELSKKKKIE